MPAALKSGTNSHESRQLNCSSTCWQGEKAAQTSTGEESDTSQTPYFGRCCQNRLELFESAPELVAFARNWAKSRQKWSNAHQNWSDSLTPELADFA